MLGCVVGCKHIPGPARERQIAAQAAEVLRGRVLLIPRLERHADVAAVPGERRAGLRPRREQRAQVVRDERIRHRDRGQVAELRQAVARVRGDRRVDVENLPVRRHRPDLVVELAEHRLAIERILHVEPFLHRHAHVAGDDPVVVRRRSLVVLRARLREQRAIVVEPEVQRIGDGRGGTVAREQIVDGRLVRQVRRCRHERALTDERGRCQQVEERHAILAEQVAAIGVADRQQRVAAAFRECGTECERRLGLRAIALLRVAVLHVEGRAFEMIQRDEVDDAGHRVRAVHGRSAAGDRLHARQNRVGHQVDVDRAEDVRERQAPAVEQHQVAIRTERMQVDGRVAAGALAAVARTA